MSGKNLFSHGKSYFSSRQNLFSHSKTYFSSRHFFIIIRHSIMAERPDLGDIHEEFDASNEEQETENSNEEKLILYYFYKGFTYQEIYQFLSQYHKK